MAVLSHEKIAKIMVPFYRSGWFSGSELQEIEEFVTSEVGCLQHRRQVVEILLAASNNGKTPNAMQAFRGSVEALLTSDPDTAGTLSLKAARLLGRVRNCSAFEGQGGGGKVADAITALCDPIDDFFGSIEQLPKEASTGTGNGYWALRNFGEATGRDILAYLRSQSEEEATS